jgi:hypothetical protein
MLIYFPWIHQKNKVFSTKIDDTNYINELRKWVISQNPPNDKSTHIWYNKLPTDISILFLKLATCDNIINMFKNNFSKNHNIDILNDMNEIYVTAPSSTKDKNTSDTIFYTKHIDGPYYLFPFASCYRLIIGLDDNSNVITCFNMIPENKIVKKGDIVAFDFHRECHYIYNQNDNNDNNENKDLRVIMKVHYCVYPYWAYYFGKVLGLLSIYYNKAFRNLFLFTLTTNEFHKKILAVLMVKVTKLVHDIEFYIGYNNISYLFIIYIISSITNSYIFLFATSFVHYFRKINSIKNACDNLVLKRDIRFYYTLYSMQLYYIYYKNITINTLLLSNLMNLLLYIFRIESILDIIKCYEIFALLTIYDFRNYDSINNLFVYSHLVLNFLEYQK